MQKAMSFPVWESRAPALTAEVSPGKLSLGKKENQRAFISPEETVPIESRSYHSWPLQQPASLDFRRVSSS